MPKIINSNIPTVLAVFGATGDLMTKKIIPALFHLFQKNKLPRFFKVVGFSNEELSDESFRDFVFKILSLHKDISIKTCKDFCELFSFERGLFQNKAGYRDLVKSLKEIDDNWGVCSNKLFYLAVPPQFYEIIFQNLAASGLTKPCSKEEGWSRVLVEKPFGKDLKTSQKLEKLLAGLFKEIQIYRIDHYLAKEMVQNILAFRFSNNLFEKTWDRNSIEKVEIKLLEKIGVKDRGSFYDGLGALRDVGQNHLLQILALLTMEQPLDFSAKAIREKRSEILKTLILPGKEEIKKYTFRAQYQGYKSIKGVGFDSATETYFKVRAFLSHPRWSGVSFILESGKRLKEQIKEAVVTFRHPVPCLCPPGKEFHYKNRITIQLEPEEKITLAFWSKEPGLEFELQERNFSFLMRELGKKFQYTEEYEKLLYDCIAGDQTLFVTSSEVEAMWKYTDPIIEAWQKKQVPLKIYSPDTNPVIAETEEIIKKEIAVVGLGKMGKNMTDRLSEMGWRALGFDRDYDFKKSVAGLSSPRIVWLMVPAGAVAEVIFGEKGLVNFLAKGDIIIDGGNSFYKDSAERFKKLKKREIHFVDVGVSGGPQGARTGASLMIGGEKIIFEKLEPLFRDLAEEGGYQFFEGPGAGHFVKMIHNGIEYGMMQAIAEGFTLLKKAKYKISLTRVADVYNHGSVIESRLLGWLKNAFDIYGDSLKNVSGAVAHTGEGAWTIKTAKVMKIKTKIIEEALKFRIQSAKKPSYAGKILSALRNQFGGHDIR